MKIDCNLQQSIETELGLKVLDLDRVSGGDTAIAYKVITTEDVFFCKVIDNASALDILTGEVSGLAKLATHINTPIVRHFNDSNELPWLLLEWLDFSVSTNESLQQFGIELAHLHSQSQDQFGLNQDNYISKLVQKNDYYSDWSEFYIMNRVYPLLKVLYDRGDLTLWAVKQIDTLGKVLELEIPKEKPSLLHGDLWSGNFMNTSQMLTYVFDPAIYYGHREMDLAMSLLFGSFGRSFYAAYQSANPLEIGFMQRVDLHQLYPILVHAILFGGHYTQKAIDTIRKYCK